MPHGSAELLRLTNGDDTREALHWFSDGEQRHALPMRFWWQTTLRRLTLGASGEEPVLVILQPFDKRSLDWRAILEAMPALFEF